jgi:hypothetical protein
MEEVEYGVRIGERVNTGTHSLWATAQVCTVSNRRPESHLRQRNGSRRFSIERFFAFSKR